MREFAAVCGRTAIGAQTRLIDLRDYELIFCDGKEDESSYPAGVLRLRSDVKQAQGLILGTPEYHGNLSGVLKNALDLMGFEEIEGKMIGLVAVSGGQTGSLNSLKLSSSGTLRGGGMGSMLRLRYSYDLFNRGGVTVEACLLNCIFPLLIHLSPPAETGPQDSTRRYWTLVFVVGDSETFNFMWSLA